MDLREWTILYVKHKDLLTRQLIGHKEEKDRLVFEFKDHKMHSYAMEKLAIPKVEGKTLVTTLQDKENIDFLIKYWKEFSRLKGLTIVFVNPAKNEKWFIVPHTHSQIADVNIEMGIRSMAENVSHV